MPLQSASNFAGMGIRQQALLPKLGDPERALYLALVPLLPVRDQSSLLRDLVGDLPMLAEAGLQSSVLALETETVLGLAFSPSQLRFTISPAHIGTHPMTRWQSS